MTDEATKLDKGRRLARRYMAYAAFHFLLLFAVVVTYSLIFSPDRLVIAQALSGAIGALGGVIGSMTTIVFFYLGVSLTEAIKRGP